MGESSSFDGALRAAYRLLAVRSRSDREVRLRLIEKGFDNALVDAVLTKLRDLNYVDDRAFARQRARHLAVNRLYGNSRIEADLREKGVSRILAAETIAEAREELTEWEAAEKLMKKDLGKRGITELDMNEKKRIFRRLMGKGFPRALIFAIVQQTEEESVHGDDGE